MKKSNKWENATKMSDLTSGSNRGSRSGELMFSIAKASAGTFQIMFTIPDNVLNKTRMRKEDKVEVMWLEESREGRIELNEGGRSKLWTNKGDSGTVRTALKWRTGMPSIAEARACHIINTGPDFIEFIFPEIASFSPKCARETLEQQALNI